MRALIFGTCFFVLFGMTSAASAQEPPCTDPVTGAKHDPLAVADANGVFNFTFEGREIRSRGHKPADMLCRYIPLKKTRNGFKTNRMYLHENRPAEFCGGLAPGHNCVHFGAEGYNPRSYRGRARAQTPKKQAQKVRRQPQ
ncbi:hypothetical protein C4568_00355 [Candidatus Parcubacteria bacterium]|nr:MAG: hypothetical protein C4568_00355 [Candidatus Parcubacteria bacterium]